MSEIERATERQLSEIERARAEQLDIARSWILLFTLAATFGLWWVLYNQLNLDLFAPRLVAREQLGTMSAFLPKVDIGTQPRNVRYVPKAESADLLDRPAANVMSCSRRRA